MLNNVIYLLFYILYPIAWKKKKNTTISVVIYFLTLKTDTFIKK